ncbi:RNA polymerase sigma factor SigZ [Roseiconus lacunae]|uniref:RNA polymerase sigma factor SigZ n=1 Tax=Roseiconus lacunae TaxID=2605694 RepID=A0ABT7PPN2_9BACT|nr:RNA polymerase sigma factor SigZ [Roseiconus lacunae]MDM4018426.1 RNA polymerase sigma factor SigZ [Roseiconus lacunae]
MKDDCKTSEEIWRQLGDQIRSFFAARIRDHQTVEDLLQEVFVRIHSRLESVEDHQRIRPWIFQIARNLLTDHYRARSREASPLAEEIECDCEIEPRLEDTVIGWLPQMLDQVPDKYRVALKLYELEGLSQQQIADRLDLSLSGAKSRIQRGRRKLKEVLYDCCSFEHDRRGNLIGFSRNRASRRDFRDEFEAP